MGQRTQRIQGHESTSAQEHKKRARRAEISEIRNTKHEIRNKLKTQTLK